jgi:hypothetical protein
MMLKCCATAMLMATAAGLGLAAPPLVVPAVSTDTLRSEGVRVEMRHTLEGTEVPEAPAFAWLGHHDGKLFVEFHVKGRADAPQAPRDDLQVFEGPSVEVFLSSMDDPVHGYYHVATNPRGAIYDEFVRDAGWSRDYRWDMPVTSVPVALDDRDGWAVRLEIPLAVLRRRVTEDAPESDLSFDLGFQLAAAGISSTGESIAVSWTPTDTTFHSPVDFGQMRLGAPIPPFGMSVETRIGDGSDDMLHLDFTVEHEPQNMGPAQLEVFLRPENRTAPLQRIYSSGPGMFPDPISHTAPLADFGNAHTLVTRLTSAEGVLLDQEVQDWPFREKAPVLAIHERFHDRLPLRIHSIGARRINLLEVRTTGTESRVVWQMTPEAGSHELDVDASAWAPGVYELRWTIGEESHSTHLARLPRAFHFQPGEWAFWGYAPDEELLAEFAAFEEMTATKVPMTGLIYGGSVDPDTGAMSAMNLESLRAWQRALPGAQLHLMIDGWGNFDQLTDEQIDRITTRLIDELMNEEIVAGIHFDLEPYRPSQIRITRALTRKGWTKGLSMATALATTIPIEQWASLDFMVAMNYDLGRTPEVFQRRAAQNARAFAQTAREAQRQVMIGIPVIATHNEYGMVVEAATGKVTHGGMEGTMLPFVNPALDVVRELQNDPELAPHLGPPALWGALARGHHVGMRRYRYFPTTISGEVWARLLEFDRERSAQ